MSEPSSVELTIPKFKSECSLTRGVEVRDLLKVRKETVLYVQPCASERGKLMGDVELVKEPNPQFLDPSTLCSLLEIHRRHFSELKCSPSLGVAKLKWKGREISIFKNGKLKIQRALDREEILRIANSVSRLIWGAVVCEVCGQPTLDCASGKCGKCTSEEGTSIKINEISNAAPLLEGYSNLEKASKSGSSDELEKYLRKAQYFVLFFTIESPKKEDAMLGLVLLGESKRMTDKLKISEPI